MRTASTHRCLALLACLALAPVVLAADPPPPPKAAHALSAPTISDEVAQLLVGLIVDSRQRPSINAVDTYAAAFHWQRNPPESNALLNAKVGYHGKINGQTVLLGSDGTNDILSVMIAKEFEPARVVAMLKQAFTLRNEGPEESAGQRSDAYTMIEHGKTVGVVFVTYGVAPAIRGMGTVAYMSAAKAREALGK